MIPVSQGFGSTVDNFIELADEIWLSGTPPQRSRCSRINLPIDSATPCGNFAVPRPATLLYYVLPHDIVNIHFNPFYRDNCANPFAMAILDKLLHRKKGTNVDDVKNSGLQPAATSSTHNSQVTASEGPGHVLTPQDATSSQQATQSKSNEPVHHDSHAASTASPPRANYQHDGGNAGMLVGAVLDSQSPVTGMLEGQVLGGMIGQRIQQAQNHAHWKNQALEYREGIASGDAARADAAVDGGNSDRAMKRKTKREERWQRRAARGESSQD